MKSKFALICLIMLSAVILINGCKKDDPEPAPAPSTPAHAAGSVEGSLTFNGSTTTVSGTSTNSSFGFVMSARNMTPANSYPAVNFDFAAKPTKDSTYAINTNNFISVSSSSDTQNDQYFSIAGGSIVVTVSGGVITASVSNVTVHNTYSGDKVATSSLSAY